MKAHSGAITALHVLGVRDSAMAAAGGAAGLITGSTDGKVQMWNSQLEATAAFDLSSLGGISKIVQSLFWDDLNHKILVASFSSEIYEMHDAEGYDMHDGPLVQGHYEHRVFGLCASPTEVNEFATVGEDRTVRVWDSSRHTVKALATLDTMAHCITFSPDGDMLAVGLGYKPGGYGMRQRKDGAFVILSRRDLTVMHEGRDSKQLISCISFSPDGGTLAVGSYDRSVYLYNTTDWASIGKCRGHKGRVMHLDFSCDNKNIQSTDDVGELLFWETSTAEQRTARSMKDTQWQTQTCTFGWALQGTLGMYDDGCLINSAARSAGGTVLITADNYSRLRCWRYPASSTNFPGFAEYRGHGGAISNTCFVSDDSYILTAGEDDNCILQWRFVIEGPPLDEPSITIELDGVQRNDLKDLKSFERTPEAEAANLDDRSKIFLMEERGGEQDFTPVRPWQRTVVAPTRPPPERIDEPCDSLRLCWIHGFRASDVKNGVRYTNTGEIVFFSGSVNVVYDVRSHTQLFHRDHTDEVMSIAVHPNRSLIATADQGKVPTILLWDYEGSLKGGSCPTVATLVGQHRRGVSHLCFSPCGKWLATVGLDDLHSLVVYDWQNQTVRCRRPTPKEKTFDLQFPPTTSDGVVQVGVNFIRFWKMDGRNMTWKSATLGAVGQWQTFTSVGFVGNRTVVGCQDGCLYLLAGSTLERSVRAHEGPVNVISSTNEGCATGGHDGIVKVWNTVLEENMVVDLATLGSVTPAVRSIQWENEQNKIVVGTLGAEIFELDGVDGSNLKEDGGPRLQGHSHIGEENWALSAHPFYPRYATAGDDATLRVWDVGKHAVRSVTPLEMPARCIAYSPKGERLAVGFGAPIKKSAMQFDGKFVVLSSSDFVVLHEGRDSQKYLTEVKWSSTGALLAFGSFDTKIYIYDCESSYSLIAVCAQHNAVIRGFDFSSDGEYLMTNCGAYELAFFESGTGMAVAAASKLKDTRWASCTATMQWCTQGCWSPQADRCDLISCDANLSNEHGNVVIATGDNYGRIRLFRYPCDTALAQAKLYRAHGGASPISKLRWVCGDQYLVSVSAKERNIMVWMHDADDAASTDARDAQLMDLDPDLRNQALGDEANLALSEVRDPQAEEMAVEQQSAKPWLSAIVEPTDGPSSDISPPDLCATLECCFGIQVSCARSALAYNALGDVVWPTANVCVVYTKESHHQKVFAEHASEVTAFAISSDGRIVATGERGNRPQVRIWDGQTCLEIGTLPAFHRNAVSCLAWSPDGMRLVSVGCDVEHSIAIYETSSGCWDDARKIAYSPGDHRAVHFACFLDPTEWSAGGSVAPINPAGSDAPKHPGFLFATGGIDHVKFWTLEGRTLTPTRGLWGEEAKIQPMLCGCCVGRTLVTGSVSGHLYVWKGRNCDRVIRAHETMVITLWASACGVVSGGGDGMVKLYNARLEHERSFSLAEAPVPPLVSSVKAVCGGLDRTGKFITKILVSTASSECYELAKVFLQ
jgi:microtubule-associated protein-like 6